MIRIQRHILLVGIRDEKCLAIRIAELLAVYVDEIPFSPYAHVQYGWCLSHQGKRAEAKEEFLEALRLDPENELAKEKMKYVQ